MNNKVYDLDFALRNLVQHESVTHYTDGEGRQWLPAYQGCVPAHTHSFKTNLGREWDVKNGWRNSTMIMPEDPRHPVNSEEAYYRIPSAILATLPEQMQKDFHIIRERVQKIANDEKEARMFAEFVLAALEAQEVNINTKKASSLVSDLALIKNILREAYGKFTRSE